MTRSGLCAWPAFNNDSHAACHMEGCTCECHEAGENE